MYEETDSQRLPLAKFHGPRLGTAQYTRKSRYRLNSCPFLVRSRRVHFMRSDSCRYRTITLGLVLVPSRVQAGTARRSRQQNRMNWGRSGDKYPQDQIMPNSIRCCQSSASFLYVICDAGLPSAVVTCNCIVIWMDVHGARED